MGEISRQDSVPQDIISACKSARSRTKHPRYPAKIKRQVVDLLQSGFSLSALSTATGVTVGAIKKWTTGGVKAVRILSVENGVTEATAQQRPVLSIRAGAVEVMVFALDHQS